MVTYFSYLCHQKSLWAFPYEFTFNHYKIHQIHILWDSHMTFLLNKLYCLQIRNWNVCIQTYTYTLKWILIKYDPNGNDILSQWDFICATHGHCKTLYGSFMYEKNVDKYNGIKMLNIYIYIYLHQKRIKKTVLQVITVNSIGICASLKTYLISRMPCARHWHIRVIVITTTAKIW